MSWSLFFECWVLSQPFHSPLSLSCIGEGNGNPLQCSCLEGSSHRSLHCEPQMVIAAMKLKDAYSFEGKLWPTKIAYYKAQVLLWQQSPSSQSYAFSSDHVWMWELDCEESWAPKDWCRSWNSNTLATWYEELTHLKRPWWWERLKAGGEGDNRGWDGWMASLTQWTPVWVNSGSWWWTGRPGVLWFMFVAKSWTRLSDWTELNWNMKMEVLDFSQDEIHWSNLLITSYLLHYLSIIIISFSPPRIVQRNISDALAS